MSINKLGDTVCKLVSEAFSVPERDIKGKIRTSDASKARAVTQYLMVVSCNITKSETARFFGVDHSSVSHNIDRVDDMQLEDKTGYFKKTLQEINDYLINSPVPKEPMKGVENISSLAKKYNNKHDPVNHPKHYNNHPSGVECIEIIRHMGFNLGNALKYIWRADLKNDAIEDINKAIWYLNDELKRRGVK